MIIDLNKTLQDSTAKRSATVASVAAMLLACAVSQVMARDPAEPALTKQANAMVVAANPLAVEAGLAVLRRGGSAMDAAVGVQMMLGLVEPQSSGIGGGSLIMTYDTATKEVRSYLGREIAPASATPQMLRDKQGRFLPKRRAMLSGRATGVPGTVAVFEAAHTALGRLPWSSLFDETIKTAEEGFIVTPRLATHIHGKFPQASASDVRAFFSHPDGRPIEVGDRLRNQAYAATMRTIAKSGSKGFYRGEIARAIVVRTRAAPLGGLMTEDDLAGYRIEVTPPLCRPIRAFVICVPPPPSSGVGLLQLMALLDGTDIDQRKPDDAQAWFLFAEASRIMYADRDRYVGDPRFVAVPVEGLLDPGYVAQRRKLIGERAGPAPEAGTPPAAGPRSHDATRDPGGTSHIVVVDGQGNAVSITTTIEAYFGSGRMVRGFFLNNELTDFSYQEGTAEAPTANSVQPGKRPRSSMSPVIILDRQGDLVGAIGSPGGSAIPAYIGKALLGLLYWNLPIDQAIGLPNLVARGTHFNGEAHAFSPIVREGLAAKGIVIHRYRGEDSGLHGVFFRNGAIEGAADPRREGVARRAQ